MQNQTRPVFVIGCYRSGTSILTWCLGQHPNLLPLEETNWIGWLSIYMNSLYQLGSCGGENSHLGSLDLDRDAFYGHMGHLINHFILDTKGILFDAARLRLLRRQSQGLSQETAAPPPSPQSSADSGGLCDGDLCLYRAASDPKQRWVDGTPENAEFVSGINRLFPEAKFIHILRHPDKVARSLMHFSALNQQDYPIDQAYQTWLRLVRRCHAAEEALGSDKVLRVYHEDLEQDAKPLIQKCLNFLGEDFNPDCLLPLRQRINSSGTWDKPLDPKTIKNSYADEAYALYQELMKEKGLVKSPSQEALASMEHDFLETCKPFSPLNKQ